ncbi:MAG: aspartate kinase [Planctomycetota bacterium]
MPSAASNVRIAIDEVPGIPVVTGFLAADERGNLTTLGSNGSDLTALFVAEAIDAEEVQLWKCVAGIQTADPKLVPHAQTINEIGYDEAIELARLGARVLHSGAALEAKRANVALRLLDVSKPDFHGTRVVRSATQAGPLALVHRPSEPNHSIVSVLGSNIGEDSTVRTQIENCLQAESIPAQAIDVGAHERSQSWQIETPDLNRALAHLHFVLFQAEGTDQSATRTLQNQVP